MARCLCVLLVLALLLCGCAQNTADPTEPTGDSTQSGELVSKGLYVPKSAVELATNGAVRSYQPKEGSYACTVLGNDLVVMGTTENSGEMTLYHGNDLEEVKNISLGANVLPTTTQLQKNAQGIGYFDKEAKAVVFLNGDFVEIGRMYLPGDITGNAWLTADWQTVYYCTENGIYAMNLQTGISRLLYEQKAYYQEIISGLGNGEVLYYALQITEGQQQYMLIDGETGVQLQDATGLEKLQTNGDDYFLPQNIRGVRFLRYGNGESHNVLWPAEEDAAPQMLFANHAVVMVQKDERQTILTYYDLQSGKRTASVTLDGVIEVWSMEGDGHGGVWFFGRNDAEIVGLYYWDSAKSAVEDSAQYTQPLYTQEAPNEEGLAQIAQSAATLGEKFGVEILVWKDAAALAPADQFFTEEYRTQLYDHYLARLEKALSIFPQEIFSKAPMGKLKIVLLQEIKGEPAWGTLSQTDCLQFLSGNVPAVAVVMNENFEQSLYHGVYLYMETRILSTTAALYEWFRINPWDFSYDNSYITNLDRTDTRYIEGDNRYFINLFSMSYAKEDRATIFEYACMPGNEEYFQTYAMQDKLRRICSGIRSAYGLKNVDTVFPWEQYRQ